MKQRLALTLAAVATLLAFDLPAADLARGRSLYELRCGGCHSDSVHGRLHRVATDFDAVRSWVVRWNETLKLGWGDEEIDDVAVHLNATYYRYPCPPAVCKVVSQK